MKIEEGRCRCWIVKCYIVDSFIGFFVYDENLKLVISKTFDSTAIAAAQLLDLERTGTCSILEELIDDLAKMGFNTFIFEDEQEAKVIRAKFGVESQAISPSEGGRAFRSSITSAYESVGLKPNVVEKMQKEISEALAKSKVRVAAEKRDRLVAEAVAGLDEIDKNINIGVSRVREWYGLHFPELDSLAQDHKQYMAIVTKFGTRSNLDLGGVNKIVQSENKAKAICDTAKSSMGAEIAGVDLKQIQELAEVNLRMYDLRDELENYIDDTMMEVAPNIRELVGSSLGARLIALTGSLEGLAKKPSSTIQVLGAEKALFRSLRTGARPPKHGIIFQHQHIHNAPRWQRGKIARALAGKISIAARVDAFGGEYIADSLKKILDKRVEDIQKKYSKPPVRKMHPEKFERRERFGGREKWGKKKWGRERRWRR
jgi:nucleolar protein 56